MLVKICDVIKWKHFSRDWPFVQGIHRSPVNSPHKGQWRGALMFSLICTRINGWVNNGEAGDLRRCRCLLWRHWNEIANYMTTAKREYKYCIPYSNFKGKRNITSHIHKDLLKRVTKAYTYIFSLYISTWNTFQSAIIITHGFLYCLSGIKHNKLCIQCIYGICIEKPFTCYILPDTGYLSKWCKLPGRPFSHWWTKVPACISNYFLY